MKVHYQETENFFNKIASEKEGYYDRPKSLPYLVQQKIRKKALAWVKDLSPPRILDAGCGRGDFALKLAKHFKEALIEGVDFSEEMMKLAQKSSLRIENLKFQPASLLNLPFEDKSFDLTFCLDTLHHIHWADQEKVIAEIVRVTREKIIIEFKNQKTIFWPLYKFLFKKSNPRINLYGLNHQKINCFFTQRGFFQEKIFPIFKLKIFSPIILVKFTRNQNEKPSYL